MCSSDRIPQSTKDSLLTDINVIRERIFRGDVTFAERVVLTALIKGDRATQQFLLDELVPEDIQFPPFDLLFGWIVDALANKGKVDGEDLYRLMEEWVRAHWPSASDPGYDGSTYSAEEVLLGYLSPVWHVLNIEMPDHALLEKAVATIKRFRKYRRSGPTMLSQLEPRIR